LGLVAMGAASDTDESCSIGSSACISNGDAPDADAITEEEETRAATTSLLQLDMKVEMDSETKTLAPAVDEIALLEEHVSGMKSKIQALKSATQKQTLNSELEVSKSKAEARIQRQKARLPMEQQASFAHLHSLMEAVKHGHVDAINGDAFASLLHEITPYGSNVAPSAALQLVQMLDKSKDGKLDKTELDDILYAKVELDDEGQEEADPVDPVPFPTPWDPAHPSVPVPPNDTSLLETKSGTQGSWQSFTSSGGNFQGQIYAPEHLYFKPRIQYSAGSGGYNVQNCFLVASVFPGAPCWGYFYTTSDGDDSSGNKCSCFPDDLEYWPYGSPAWKWYVSGIGNHIYFSNPR